MCFLEGSEAWDLIVMLLLRRSLQPGLGIGHIQRFILEQGSWSEAIRCCHCVQAYAPSFCENITTTKQQLKVGMLI